MTTPPAKAGGWLLRIRGRQCQVLTAPSEPEKTLFYEDT